MQVKFSAIIGVDAALKAVESDGDAAPVIHVGADTYTSADDWYATLCVIAGSHSNSGAIRDRDGWIDNWENKSPQDAYYAEFPEHMPPATMHIPV